MGKLMALLAAGTGTATVSVGGFYLVKGSGMGTTGVITQINKDLKFKTLQEFKNNKAYKCSSNTPIFAGKDFESNAGTSANNFAQSAPAYANFFGDPSTNTSDIKSCLIVNGEKTTYTPENKWSGIFTGTGSFENNNKGFVVVNIAKAETSGQLSLTGGAYLLEKAENSNWEIKYKKEVTTTAKKIDASGFETKFPKVKENSGVSVGDGSYWGFVTGSGDLSNICGGSSACPSTVKETIKEWKEFRGTKEKSETSKKISEGSAVWAWWDDMYTKSDFDLEASLEKFKGTWSKVGDQ